MGIYSLRGSNGRHYYGSTTDLERRLKEHQRGHTYSTKRLGENLEIVASREFSTLPEARTFERKLKAFKNPSLAINKMKNT
ncbi:MAG: GIY-YIG nuclease family protein [Chthoniobacterales bacterium]